MPDARESLSSATSIAIAAQAMTNILENLNGVAAIGVGIGLMTVVGQFWEKTISEENSYR